MRAVSGWEEIPATTCSRPRSTARPPARSIWPARTGQLQNGATVPLTVGLAWSVTSDGPCPGAAGMISAQGLLTAVTASCAADVNATYTPSSGAAVTSNTFTVTVN